MVFIAYRYGCTFSCLFFHFHFCTSVRAFCSIHLYCPGISSLTCIFLCHGIVSYRQVPYSYRFTVCFYLYLGICRYFAFFIIIIGSVTYDEAEFLICSIRQVSTHSLYDCKLAFPGLVLEVCIFSIWYWQCILTLCSSYFLIVYSYSRDLICSTFCFYCYSYFILSVIVCSLSVCAVWNFTYCKLVCSRFAEADSADLYSSAGIIFCLNSWQGQSRLFLFLGYSKFKFLFSRCFAIQFLCCGQAHLGSGELLIVVFIAYRHSRTSSRLFFHFHFCTSVHAFCSIHLYCPGISSPVRIFLCHGIVSYRQVPYSYRFTVSFYLHPGICRCFALLIISMGSITYEESKFLLLSVRQVSAHCLYDCKFALPGLVLEVCSLSIRYRQSVLTICFSYFLTVYGHFRNLICSTFCVYVYGYFILGVIVYSLSVCAVRNLAYCKFVFSCLSKLDSTDRYLSICIILYFCCRQFHSCLIAF